MSDNNPICIPFPHAQTIKIPLPFGVEISSITDFSRGPATDCAIAHSLMLQVSPMLAGMTCLMRVLKVIKELKDFVNAVPNPVKIAETAPKLIQTIDDLLSCFLLLDPCQLSKMISGILCMVISYLNCFIEAFESIYHFQLGLDLNAASGNPVLLANLQCAQDNAQASMQSMMDGMQGVQPLLDMVGMLMEIVGLPPMNLPTSFATPALGAGQPDPIAPVIALRDALVQANAVLPCKQEC